ncbi:hypothetical protein LHYA1_G003698 [Lachnellula hyalina]|uniref:Zn(2)-C6 fungal-type domain-containing protein n=1 Tax=Lachnellula hyalina TaxID=1316788 RepID=A0A8H8R4D6_9HELO|nr:uncharacterized protein LHYA1_G003698 [Lachnellula hyalina]TVY28318.1 hypothetical protein LHYA1_G003698 [Lachnellula hyalina]
MDNPMSQNTYERQLPRDGEQNMSMFFDFGTAQELGDFQPSTTTQNQETASRGGIRVSLACIPCRSRHVKCGAEMPNCSRCLQDDKPCFYAKSRRGMRDRNAPRKKSPQGGKVSPVLGPQVFRDHNAMGYAIGTSSSGSYTGLSSETSLSPASSSLKSASPARLIDLYYNFFYKAHPFVLPRYYFFSRLENDPESLKHLRAVIQYIGSLYAPDIPSAEHKELALSQLDLPNMPPNGFTVQTLLLIAIVFHCDDEMDRAREVLDRAIYLALELRMNSREFANIERDPVLAESWRRTYWGLFVTDSMIAGITRAPSFMPPAYVIPRARTFAEYDDRDFEDETPIFSSFTYLVDLCRIFGSLLNLDQLSMKDRELAVANADAMLVNWKLHLPPEKRGVIDKDEQVDELLFQAQGLLQVLLIFIHRPLSRLAHSPIEKISRCAPPPSSLTSPPNPRTLWLHTRKTILAAETAIDLLALPCPLLNHTPLSACSFTLTTLACLSACCYVLEGQEWLRMRDRVRLGLGGLKAFGEVWGTSRRTEGETKRIARAVFEAGGTGEGSSGMSPETGQLVNSGDSVEQIGFGGAGDMMGGMEMGWEDLREMEYLGMLDRMGQQGQSRFSI